MSEAPKPCLFCGGTDIRITSSGGVCRMACRKCHAQGPIAKWQDIGQGATPQETWLKRSSAAVKAWNARAKIIDGGRG